MNEFAQAVLSAWSLVGPILSFLLGFYVGKPKERFDMNEKRTENASNSRAELEALGKVWIEALSALKKAKGPQAESASIEDLFLDARMAGDAYFGHIESIASRIRRGSIDQDSFENDFRQDLVEIAVQNIPAYYQTLRYVADRHGLRFSDEIDFSTSRNLRLLLKGHMSRDAYRGLLVAWGLARAATL